MFTDWWTNTVETNLLSPMITQLCADSLIGGALCPLSAFITTAFEYAKALILLGFGILSGETVEIGAKIDLLSEISNFSITRANGDVVNYNLEDVPGLNGLNGGAYYA